MWPHFNISSGIEHVASVGCLQEAVLVYDNITSSKTTAKHPQSSNKSSMALSSLTSQLHPKRCNRGLTFILLCAFARAFADQATYDLVVNPASRDFAAETSSDFYLQVKNRPILEIMTRNDILTTSVGALIVHLWLPFFALCVGILKGLNYFLLAAHTAQWFLKRGKDHPLEAIGFVATPLVFRY
jgi:hypothetical protein